MPASPTVAQMFPGVHRIRKRTPAGVSEYWYAWRGGPQILKATAKNDGALLLAVARETPAAAQRFEAIRRPRESVTLYGLITRYLDALEDMKGAPRTKSDRRKHLDRVRTDIGHLEVAALDAKGARKVLVDWRNGYKATPKTADELMGALAKVIKWAMDQGEVHHNPIADVERLYHVDRAEIIWEPHHLELLLKHSAKEFADFVQMAVNTGMRLADLRRVPWSAVGEEAIIFQTGKSRGRRTIVVPMTDALRDVLAVIPRRDTSLTILNSARGRPWSEAGVESALQRAKRDALAEARKRYGPEAKSDIEHRRIHDFRGTAATNFIRAGLDDRDIAEVLGWKADRVAEIRRRYVSGQEIGLAIARRLRENKARAESVNRPVNLASEAG